MSEHGVQKERHSLTLGIFPAYDSGVCVFHVMMKQQRYFRGKIRMVGEEGNENSTQELEVGEVGLSAAALKTLKGTIPLSPLKHALCVVMIWLFIVGAFAWWHFYVYMFPIWIAIGFFLEEKWRKQYGIYFLSYNFTQWLYASYFWELFIRRCNIGSGDSGHFLKLAGLSFALSVILVHMILLRPPPIDLNQMRMVSGTLEQWQHATGSRDCGDIITLQYEDGKNEKFRCAILSRNDYQQVQDQIVTIWVVRSTYDIRPECREFEHVKQLQHGGHTIGFPYNKAFHEGSYRLACRALFCCIFAGLFFLMMVWLINRRKKSQLNEDKEPSQRSK